MNQVVQGHCPNLLWSHTHLIVRFTKPDNVLKLELVCFKLLWKKFVKKSSFFQYTRTKKKTWDALGQEIGSILCYSHSECPENLRPHSPRELIKVGCNVTEVGAGFPMLLALSACVNLLPVVLNHPSFAVLFYYFLPGRNARPSINAAFTLFFFRRMTRINSVRTIKGTRQESRP